MMFRVDTNRIGADITENKNLQSSQVQGKSTSSTRLAHSLLAKADEKSKGCRLFLLLLISTRGFALVLLHESSAVRLSPTAVLWSVVAVSFKRLVLIGTFSWLRGQGLAGALSGREPSGRELPDEESPVGELPGEELLGRELPR